MGLDKTEEKEKVRVTYLKVTLSESLRYIIPHSQVCGKTSGLLQRNRIQLRQSEFKMHLRFK